MQLDEKKMKNFDFFLSKSKMGKTPNA